MTAPRPLAPLVASLFGGRVPRADDTPDERERQMAAFAQAARRAWAETQERKKKNRRRKT